MSIQLTHKIPLRSSAIFDKFNDASPLPWVYGDARVGLIPLDKKGVRFAVCDHAVTRFVALYRNDAITTAYQPEFSNGATLIKLQKPLAAGETLALDLVGINLYNPADILLDVLQRCGITSVTRARLADFRADCSALDIRLSGAIKDDSQTIRSVIDGITTDCGSVWSALLPTFAQLYPVIPRAAQRPIAERFTRRNISSIQRDITASDISTRFEIGYNLDFATGTPMSRVAIVCPQGVERYGAITKTATASWIKTREQALRSAARMAVYFSSQKLTSTIFTRKHGLSVGDYVEIEGVEGFTLKAGYDTLTAESLGLIPTITSIALISEQAQAEKESGIEVGFDNGVLTITLTDSKQEPIAGANCTLDGDITRLTDAQGKVTFQNVALGSHLLHVEATGFTPLDFEFEL